MLWHHCCVSFVFKAAVLIGWLERSEQRLASPSRGFFSLKACLEEMSPRIEIFWNDKGLHGSFVVTSFNVRALWIFFLGCLYRTTLSGKLTSVHANTMSYWKLRYFLTCGLNCSRATFPEARKRGSSGEIVFHGGFLQTCQVQSARCSNVERVKLTH